MSIRVSQGDSSAGRGRTNRYRLFTEIGSGGMATIHLGARAGASNVVALKRLHPQFAKDPEFVAMFMDEARVASRIAHPNVIRVLDAVVQEGELLLVMEYVLGAPLSLLLRRARAAQRTVPMPIVGRILVDLLSGLHAAHETRDETGLPLDIVHRDVSPQNVLVGGDGVSRVFDFGIAKAAGRAQTSQKGQLKGKLSYVSPEQIHEDPVTRRSDVYAASVVLWEALTGRRLFRGDDDFGTLAQVLAAHVPPPSVSAPGLSDALDAIVLRGLDRDASNRFATAMDMAFAIEASCRCASRETVAAWVSSHAHAEMASTAATIGSLERELAIGVTAATCLPSIDLPVLTPASIQVPCTGPLLSPGVTTARRYIPRRASMLALAALVELAAILLGVWLASGMHASSIAAKARYSADAINRRTR